MDRSLSFNAHVKKTTEDATNKLKLLAKISHSEWGGDKFDLLKIYKAIVRSKLDYASPAWQPWISPTSLYKLDVVQNKSLRLVTGQTRSTKVEALRAEAGTVSYKSISERETLKALEKAARLPSHHPKSEMLHIDSWPKNKRTSWRSKGTTTRKSLPPEASDRLPLKAQSRPPWTEKANYEIFPNLPGISRKDEISSADTKEIALNSLISHQADKILYTDGSAYAGSTKGGSAVIVAGNDPRNPVVTEEILEKGSPFTSSYEEILAAMANALVQKTMMRALAH